MMERLVSQTTLFTIAVKSVRRGSGDGGGVGGVDIVFGKIHCGSLRAATISTLLRIAVWEGRARFDVHGEGCIFVLLRNLLAGFRQPTL